MSKIQDLKKLRSVNSKNSSSTLNQPLPPQETEQPVNQIVNQDVSSNLNQNDISNITSDNVNQVLPQISTQVPIMPTSNPSQSNLMNNSISIKQSIENDEQYIKKKDHIEIDALDEKQKKTLLMTEVPLAFDSKDLFTFHDLIVASEKKTPSAKARIACAVEGVKRGFAVRLCFDPMLYLPNWKEYYGNLLEAFDQVFVEKVFCQCIFFYAGILSGNRNIPYIGNHHYGRHYCLLFHPTFT